MRQTKKKGQVTIYIIIGIVALIFVGFLFYLKTNLFDENNIPDLESVPSDFQKIQGFVIGCVDLVGREAIIKIGEHGGYLDPRNPTASGRSFKIDPNVFDSDIVFLSQEHAIPYWWYMSTSSDCKECVISDGLIPSIDEIQNQINWYVDQNLGNCLADFQSFKDVGYDIIPQEEIKTKSIINQEGVQIYVNYPLDIQYNNKKETIQHFPGEVNVNFLEMYSLAMQISQGEKQGQFLEGILLYIISTYSGKNSASLPPIAAFDESFNTVTWNLMSVKMQLEELLQSYVQMIQINNTENYQELSIDDQNHKTMYKLFTLPNNVFMPNKEINFIYLNWPIYLDITPNEDGVLKPTIYRKEFPYGVVPATQTNHYEYFYDVSFPVVVEVRDTEAFDGEGFSFLIAIEGNIRDNINLLEWNNGQGTFGEWDYSSVSFEVQDESGNPATTPIFNPDTNETKNVTYEPTPKILMCNENQRISGEFNLIITDAKTGQPISDAGVTFGCGNYASCPIGSTDEKGEFKGKFPICAGEGYLVIDKEGYRPVVDSGRTILPDTTGNFEFKLEPLKEFNIEYKLIHADNFPKKFRHYNSDIIRKKSTDLEKSYKVLLSLTKIKDDPFEPLFNQLFEITGENPNYKFYLTEGKYELFSTVVDEDGLVIPEHIEFMKGQIVDVPEMDLTPLMLGGALINEENGYFIVNKDDLEKSDKLTLYLITVSPPKTMVELENLTLFMNYSMDFRTVIEPELE